MPDPITTHPFVRGVLASLCHDADGPLMPEHGLGRARLPETLRHLYRAPGVRFAGRGGRERPLSRDGAVTCHFSQTSVSKTSPILARIRAAKAGRCYQGSRAVAHEAYIERPGAAERLGPARSRRATGRDGREQQAYLERDGAVEADPDAALALASFGTIGDTPEERARFWTLVEESERSARGDRIRIAPGRDPDWWARALSAIDAAPEAARATLRAAGPQRSAPLTLTLPTEDAFALWRWAIGLGADAPVAIAPGRGGRIQTRIIAELPHEIDARQRLAIVEAFTGKLEAKGFPYWAVVHAPDERNDARNVHVHIVYYDRPARQMPHPDTGAPSWDFAITCERRRANRTRVLTRPYRQPKDRASHDRTWIGELRANWGACCNAVLAEAGIAKRYDLRAYATIGIGQAPGVHIPARQYNKERKGALTEAGADLARRQWQAEADRILEARAAATGTQIGLFLQRGRQAEFAVPSRGAGQSNAAARAGIGDPGEPVRALIRRGLALVVEIGRLELARDLARLVCARTLSRPRLLLAASTVLKHARGAKADPGGITGEDPPVPEGAPFGLARRSALAGLCERLDRGRDSSLRPTRRGSRTRPVGSTGSAPTSPWPGERHSWIRRGRDRAPRRARIWRSPLFRSIRSRRLSSPHGCGRASSPPQRCSGIGTTWACCRRRRLSPRHRRRRSPRSCRHRTCGPRQNHRQSRRLRSRRSLLPLRPGRTPSRVRRSGMAKLRSIRSQPCGLYSPSTNSPDRPSPASAGLAARTVRR